jgi:hypothetical protein
MKHNLKPLTILSGEENRAIFYVMASLLLENNLNSILINIGHFVNPLCGMDIECDYFKIPEKLLEMRGSRKIQEIVEYHDPKFMPIELKEPRTKSVVFYYFPEIGLHPSKQRRLARHIARLVNKGVYFVIATHSMVFVREINNLLLLGRKGYAHTEKARAFMNQENSIIDQYSENEGLKMDDVAMFITTKHEQIDFSIKELEKDDTGYHETSFDQTNQDMLRMKNALIYQVFDDE